MKHITGDYFYKSDSRNHVLCKRRIVEKNGQMRKKGDAVYDEIAFYSNIEPLAKQVLNNLIREEVTDTGRLFDHAKEVLLNVIAGGDE